MVCEKLQNMCHKLKGTNTKDELDDIGKNLQVGFIQI